MFKVLKNRIEQGCKTSRYPKVKVELPPEDTARLASREAANISRDAYDLYLKARELFIGRENLPTSW